MISDFILSISLKIKFNDFYFIGVNACLSSTFPAFLADFGLGVSVNTFRVSKLSFDWPLYF